MTKTEWTADKKLKKLKYKQSGKTIYSQIFTGTITDISNRSETNVYGGGGTIVNGSGHLNDIESVTTQHQEFFIKSKKGEEKTYTYHNLGIPMRVGHKTSLVSIERGNKSFLVIHVSHDLKKYFYTQEFSDLAIKLRLASSFAKWNIAFTIAGAALFLLSPLLMVFMDFIAKGNFNFDSVGGAAVLLLIYFAIPGLMLMQFLKLQKWKKILNHATDALGQALLKAEVEKLK